MGKKRLQTVQQRQTGFVEKRLQIFILIGVVAVASMVVYFVVYQPSSGEKNNQNTNNPNNSNNQGGDEGHGVKIRLTTSMGDIVIELFSDMSMTAGNFKNLTEYGVYDGTIFHRVVRNFVVQGGDAASKGILVPSIRDELPNKHSNVRGSVAMAKTSAPDSATSQFYINLVDNSANLDSNYSVFGQVIEGMSVVDSIGGVAVDTNDKPLQDVTLIRAQVIS